MKEYKGNSNKSKEQTEEKKTITPVVKGNITVKKDSVGKKFSDVFLSDTVDNVKSYLVFDVIIPALKDLFVDATTNGINMLVNGNTYRSNNRKKHSGEHTSYTSYYRGGSSSSYDRKPIKRDRFGLTDIAFENRADAKEVIDMLMELLENYKVVSVADYYELSNASELETYLDHKYGWYELDDLQISRDRDGYKIKLPRPEPID